MQVSLSGPREPFLFLLPQDSAREEPGEPGAPAMGAKSLCIPFQQPGEALEGRPCIYPHCSVKPQFFTMFGRSY